MNSVRVGTAGGPLLLTLDSVLFDPERPQLSPDALWRERQRSTVPQAGDRHCCPFCQRILPETMQVDVNAVGVGWKQFEAPFSGDASVLLADRFGGDPHTTTVEQGRRYYLEAPQSVRITSRGLFTAHLAACFQRHYSTTSHRGFTGARPNA